MTALDLDLDATQLARLQGSPTQVSDEVLEVPPRLPDSVGELADEVTANVDSDFEKAVALQQWFREDGDFTYDLRDSPEGNGIDDLATFLDPDIGRVGYCEQFAASMAVMARLLGIPARVAVGFLDPDPVPGADDTYVYSAHDLHAWPELFFPGAGWVRFEPTPGGPDGRAQTVPDYTRQGVDVGDPSTQSSAPSPSAGPTTSPGADPRTAPTEEAPDQTGDQRRRCHRRRLPVADAADLGVRDLAARRCGARAAAAARPPPLGPAPRRPRGGVGRAARHRDRPRPRLAGGSLTARGAGAPRAAVRPARRPLPRAAPQARPGAVPRGRRRADRITDELERLRYARDHVGADGRWADDVQIISEALAAGVQPRVRRKAEWWPRSAFQPGAPEVHERDDASVAGRVVEHV